MSTHLVRNDDLLVHDQPAQHIEIRSAQPLPVPTAWHFFLKLWLAFALLLTFGWISLLGWVTFRVMSSLL
jgi:hypothetical protein